jgi:hypothetical protein
MESGAVVASDAAWVSALISVSASPWVSGSLLPWQ